VIPHELQSFDASIDIARGHASKAMTDPVTFLDYAEVFPGALRDSDRFRDAFARAYQRIADDGAVAAMASAEG